jgi:alginate O-acetyltransferase complex protein AlgI
MIFYSPTFLVFLVVFLFGLRFVGHGAVLSWYVLLASYVFYAWWNPAYVPVLLGLSLMGWWGGVLVARRPDYLAAVVVALLLPLAVFKYATFIIANIEAVVAADFGFDEKWPLPLGVSFITFTVISYVIDVHRRSIASEPGFLQIGLFAAFFPHLIAGPILRARELLPQLRTIHLNWPMLPFGLLLFAVGAAKKVILADGIAPWVDRIYGASGQVGVGEALVAIYGFAAQIYLDFSGYTDMALGIAIILGVRLPRNFERPYLAGSVREFWRRWHMTLSRWLRDYLYIPFGGNRLGFGRMLAALMGTMLIGGLWHGAAWTFVLWGGVHGGLLVVEQLTRRYLPSLAPPPLLLRRLLVFHFVALTWILFRSPTIDHAAGILGGLASPQDWSAFATEAAWPITLIVLAALFHPVDNVARIRWLARRLPVPVAVTLAVLVMALCAALSVGNPGTFIYFDF